MKDPNDIDFTTLNWVKQELDDTLKQAAQALEAYVEDSNDKSQLRFCVNYMHQVQGTLRMIELYGAAMVVEEMERLANGLIDGEVKQSNEVLEVLMTGLVQLPDYLGRLQGGHRDIPIVLLPLLNDLRACRSEKLLSETALFSPDLAANLPSSASGAHVALSESLIKSNASKFRLAYQFGLLKWIKGDDIAGNLTRLITILDRLRAMSVQVNARRLWWIAAGVLEGVSLQALDASVAVKLLYGKVDREIKRLVDAGEADFERAPPTDLSKSLLYYAAQAKPAGARLVEIKQLYKLDVLLPSQAEIEHAKSALSGRNRALLDTVGGAIKEDVMRVKDGLDLYLRAPNPSVNDLAPLGELLQRVGDTLGVLGLGVPRKVVLEQRDVLTSMLAGKIPAEEQGLLDVAGSLLFVESSLDDYIERLGQGQQQESALKGLELPSAEVRRILDATMKEATVNLSQAKQDIVAFIEAPWDHSKIENIPKLLEEISGALRMLSMPEPAQLNDAIGKFVDTEFLRYKRVPTAEQLDLMADALASIEYYLEAIREARPNRDRILDVTKRSLEALGYWPLPDENALGVGAQDIKAIGANEFVAFSDELTITRHDTQSQERTLSLIEQQQLPSIDIPSAVDAQSVPDLSVDLTGMVLSADTDRTPVIAGDFPLGSDSLTLVNSEQAVSVSDDVAFSDFDFSAIDGESQDAAFVSSDDASAFSEFTSDDAVTATGDSEVALFSDDFNALDTQTPEVEAQAAVDDGAFLDFDADLFAKDDVPPPVAAVVPVSVAVPGAPKVPDSPAFKPIGNTGFQAVLSDDIDDEIREVFVEEVQDELDGLGKTYPAWKADPNNFEKLKPVRRSFHTLKGSGRLVGALAIGEFSWKIENMLNRALDKSIPTSAAMVACLDEAMHALPQLLTGLKGQGSPMANIGGIMHVADRISAGEEIFLPKTEPATSETDAQDASAGLMAGDLAAVETHAYGVSQMTNAAAEVAAEATGPLAEMSLDLPKSELEQAPNFSQSEAFDLNAPDARLNQSSFDHSDPQPAIPEALSSDPMLTDILIVEAQSHVATIRRQLEMMQLSVEPQPVNDELLRAVHTLNGAISMVELPLVSHVVSPLEGLLKRMKARGDRVSEQEQDVLRQSADLVDSVISGLRVGSLAGMSSDVLAERVTTLRNRLPEPEIQSFYSSLMIEEDDSATSSNTDLGGENLFATTPDPDDLPVEDDLAVELDSLFDLSDARERLDAPISAASATETEEDVFAISNFDLLEADVEADAISAPALDASTERMLEELVIAEKQAFAPIQPDTSSVIDSMDSAVDPQDDLVLTDLAFLDAELIAPDNSIASQLETSSSKDAFVDLEVLNFDAEELAPSGSEGTELVQGADTSGLDFLFEEEINLVELQEVSAVETNEARPNSEAVDASDALFSELDFAASEPVETIDLGALLDAEMRSEVATDSIDSNGLDSASDQIAEPLSFSAEPVVQNSPQIELAPQFESPAARVTAKPSYSEAPLAKPVDASPLSADADSLDADFERRSLAFSGTILPIAPDTDPTGQLVLTDSDPELLEIFVEEGRDILDSADKFMVRLRDEPDNKDVVTALQRELHTLKGGARMAGVNAIGDLSHAMESLFEAIVDNRAQNSNVSMEALERSFDRLHQLVQRVGANQAIGGADNIISRLEAILDGREDEFVVSTSEVARQAPAADETTVEAQVEALSPPSIKSEPTQVTPKPDAKPVARNERKTALDEAEASRQQQESIRVRADLIDNLVNYAGEVSIYRSRLEAQIGGFRFNLQEFDQTVLRLRDQLRKLELETEAQILSRYQREEAKKDVGFDPLELDRFSTLQQLSRALAESVSDLVSLQGLMDDIARQSETLLLQQSRVSTDLQEGLMRTRMVPFDSVVPRLRRIIRQTAGELGKKAQLRVEGAQGEMDRTVMERMTAPLEHMLRNAIAHGLESPDQRRLAGKAEEGLVTIAVARESTEVVLKVTDDGFGMDRDAIRRKAIERGLLRQDAQLSDRDLLQFVLETGFSTAESVSKIAGRGVGMDVVNSEIKQLGGSLQIDSTRGKGTVFTVRLPFTLSVTQAILIKIADTSFAIPLSAVAGVVRMPRKELDRRLAANELDVNYAGETYQIYDLGDLIRQPIAHANDEIQVPLIMTRTGDQRAAVRVSSVLGSKEVVVKSVGAQLSSVVGFFGATIMGDGSVVVILDLAPLVRHGSALRQAPELAEQLDIVIDEPVVEVKRQKIVMVVDDSITMRKVTTRVLERHDLQVVTAKDGLDAVERLQDLEPDLMLLDIEMPRMDGYELATYMKNDSRLKQIPIMMITSRTGDKHRQRAMEIGVERYLGKPYQESDLLKNVTEMLNGRRT